MFQTTNQVYLIYLSFQSGSFQFLEGQGPQILSSWQLVKTCQDRVVRIIISCPVSCYWIFGDFTNTTWDLLKFTYFSWDLLGFYGILPGDFIGLHHRKNSVIAHVRIVRSPNGSHSRDDIPRWDVGSPGLSILCDFLVTLGPRCQESRVVTTPVHPPSSMCIYIVSYLYICMMEVS